MSDLLPTTKNFQIIQSVGLVTGVALAKRGDLISIALDKIPALLWQRVPGP